MVQMRMLFSPKHHYKVADHGTVDFKKYNFENGLMKMVRNEVPNCGSADAPKMETEIIHVPKEVSEEQKEDSSSKSCSSNDATAVLKNKVTDVAPCKDFHARIEEFLAETNSKKVNSNDSAISPNREQVLGEGLKKEVLDFIKTQIPDLVDEHLKSRVITVRKQMSAQENEVSVDTEETVRLLGVEAETTNAVDAAETTDESISVALASIEQPLILTHPNNEAPAQCSTDFEQRHQLDLLFHENESAKFTVRSGSLFNKLWCVLNSGKTAWCKNSFVIETSCNGFEVASSHVDILEPNEVGNIFACVKVPEKSGLYNLEFKVLSDHGNEFIVNARLGCYVNVVGNPIEYSRSLSEAGSCRGEIGSHMDTNSLSIGERDENMENVAYEDCSQENGETSICEDETVMDEDHFGSTDDELEMIGDFTFIPLPDCFDLNRVPAMQSTSIYSCRSAGTMGESKRGTDIARKEESEIDEVTVDSRDRRFSEISAELVDPPSQIEDNETSRTISEECSVNDAPQEKTLNSCERNEEKRASPETGLEESPTSSGPACDETNFEMGSIGGSEESEPNGTAASKYITPSAEKQVQQKLNGLGFCDKEKNLKVLVKHDFDFEKALAELIGDLEPLRSK